MRYNVNLRKATNNKKTSVMSRTKLLAKFHWKIRQMLQFPGSLAATQNPMGAYGYFDAETIFNVDQVGHKFFILFF